MPRAPAGAGWRALLVALGLAICWLAFSPHPPEGLDTGWDKLNHLAAFSALGLCAARGFALAPAWRIALALLGYGVFIEAVQTQVPGRSGEWPDLLADALGIALGLLLHRIAPRARNA